MRREVVESLPVSCDEAFALTHDYNKRLQWDTLLSKAYLEGGATAAAVGVVATCVGKGLLGLFAFTTKYVSFQPGKVAAVKLLNQPPMFAHWAASIRHRALGSSGEASEIVYCFNFAARPRWLAWLFEPVMARIFEWETRQRLAAMKAHFAAQKLQQKTSA